MQTTHHTRTRKTAHTVVIGHTKNGRPRTQRVTQPRPSRAAQFRRALAEQGVTQ